MNLYDVCLGKEGENENKQKKDAELFFRSMPSMLINRARQNVVLEFGFFMGRLGRDRVCCLYREGVKLPSDMQGIVYIPFKKSLNEIRDKIAKELKAAGYNIPKEKMRTRKDKEYLRSKQKRFAYIISEIIYAVK